MSVRELGAQETRLMTIAFKLAIANSASCSVRQAHTGLVLHDLRRYDIRMRAEVSRAFSLRDGIGVLGVVPGSPAADAGVRVDDEIISVGGYNVIDREAFSARKSFDRMEQFHQFVQAAAGYGNTDLIVRRGGEKIHLPMRTRTGCAGRVTLASSNTANAWADGRHIIITTAMTDQTRSDDEAAFVVAHEMAHNILGHLDGGGARGIFGLGGARRSEIEADRFAVRLMRSGGYQPAGGMDFLRRASKRMWWSFSLDHPGFGKRLSTVAKAMQETVATNPRLI